VCNIGAAVRARSVSKSTLKLLNPVEPSSADDVLRLSTAAAGAQSLSQQAVTANRQSTALQRPRSNTVMRSTILNLAHRKLVARNALQSRILPTAQSSEFRSTPAHQRPAASSPAHDTSLPKPSSRATSFRGSHGSAGSGTPPQPKRQLSVSPAATNSIADMAGGGRDFDVVVWVSGAARTQP